MGTQNDIGFDGTNTPILARSDGDSPDCVGLLSSNLAQFAFLPQGCTGSDCNGVRASVSALNGASLIPEHASLYSCRVTIAPNAAPGTYPLGLTGVVLIGPNGVAIANAQGEDGAVYVQSTRTPGVTG